MTDESTSGNAKHRSIVSRMMMWAIGMLLVVVLYILSIGPVSVIYIRTMDPKHNPNHWFLTLYRPLLNEDSSFYYEWVEPYCHWWWQITNTEY